MFSNMQQVFEWGGGGLFLALLFLLNYFLFNLKKWGGGGYSPQPLLLHGSCVVLLKFLDTDD